MNRFRTKKRGKDEASAPRPSQDSESSMTFLPFRKGKKAQETEKLELDLTNALPPSDDFRTSLLMTGLSARFSMLREQDDPSTKIGKASDDSVLHPKRQSRLDYGAFRGLGDIAEVESVKAPFARKESYNSSDDTDSLNAAGVLGRSKPIEGNNLFGGRQKIYKIPVGANSSKSIGGGGMGGRALYDDDVAMSAFQKWRQAERERKSLERSRDGSEERRLSGDMESELPRSESPSLGSYNRKRETSSTTSSIPSQARNSTAATSVTSSQQAPSLKDWQPSTSTGSGMERNMTRTRRLYETGLHNELHEQQSSSLFRIDTLARQRTFGTRTPDLPLNTPSPTTTTFVERFGGERRILAKASAPNLRSVSPSTTSPAATPDLGGRLPSSGGESRPSFGGAPPLSPPISETDEMSLMAIGPDDRGKATALGVFQRPSQPYDESRYAQKQIQLHQGRETPTMRMHDEPKMPTGTRSRSSSSTWRQPIKSRTGSSTTVGQQQPKEEIPSTSFLADADADSEVSSIGSPKKTPSPRMLLRRPSDREHPAFRDSAMPTPLYDTKPEDELFLTAETPSSAPQSKDISPADSPTLGPTEGAGLSGMVRQHLRAASNASSIYGPYSTVPPTADLESRFPPDTVGAGDLQDLAADANPWGSRDWNLDIDVNEPIPETESVVSQNENNAEPELNRAIRRESRDEFASQLADGARRVRERLTTYVETDSRSSSPHETEDQDEPTNLPPPSRQNGLGILRPKGSRGSLMDRNREPSQTKAMKMLGFNGNGPQATVSGREPTRDRSESVSRQVDRSEMDNQITTGSEESKAGIRAFNQARRDLQRLREMEVQVKHQQPPQGSLPEAPSPRSAPRRERPTEPTIRAPSGERQQSPPSYRHRGPGDESRRNVTHPDSRSSSRAERDRSGSDSSNGGRSNSRPPRPRENVRLAPTTGAPRPQLRSPGLPGTDIKHSPIMPPQLHPNLTAKLNQLGFAANGQPYSHNGRGNDSGMPSPVSPMPSPFMNSGRSTPGLPSSPRRPSVPHNGHYDGPSQPSQGINDAMRRRVKTKDISEPTFVMSTSRVPTVSLPPEAARNRSRSNSRSAPPLPPINPRRRQDGSRTRTIKETMARFRGEDANEGASASMPNLPLEANENEDDSNMERRRLRKFHPDGEGTSPMVRASNPAPINVGPPASRMVVTQGRDRSSNVGLPGGMI